MKNLALSFILISIPWSGIAQEIAPCSESVLLFVGLPEYPTGGRTAVNEGYVELQFIIGEDGVAQDISVIESYSEPDPDFSIEFIESAKSALAQRASFNPGGSCFKTYRFSYELRD